MAPTKAQANKSRGKRKGAGRRTQTAPLTRLLILDALRTWVIPVCAGAVGLVIFVLYNIELVESEIAVTIVGVLGLVVVLFYGLRGFIDDELDARLASILIVYALLWSATAFVPFYRAINPGTPLFSADLKKSGPAVTVPMHGRAGEYNLIVEGHFLPSEGRTNRTAKYSLAIGRDAHADRIVEGTFSQEWGSQRIGAGRRSTSVPVMHQTTRHLETIDDSDGHDLVVKLTDLSPEVRDTITLRVYDEGVPRAVLIILGVLVIAGAVLIDGWRDKGESEGLLTTLTVATLISVVVFRNSSTASPGFPQLIIAVLVGTLAGAVGSSLLWRLLRPLHKYMPARP